MISVNKMSGILFYVDDEWNLQRHLNLNESGIFIYFKITIQIISVTKYDHRVMLHNANECQLPQTMSIEQYNDLLG